MCKTLRNRDYGYTFLNTASTLVNMVNTLYLESETEPHLEMNLQYLDLKNGLVMTENLMMFSEQINTKYT